MVSRVHIARQPAILVIVQFLLLFALFYWRQSEHPLAFERPCEEISAMCGETAGNGRAESDGDPMASGQARTGNPAGTDVTPGDDPSSMGWAFWGSAAAGEASGHIYTLPLRGLDSRISQIPALHATVVFLMLVVISLMLTRYMSHNLAFPPKRYLPAMLYLIACCGIFFGGYSFSVLLAALLVVSACRVLASSFVREESFGISFRGAFLMGIAPVIYPRSAPLLLLVPVAMALFRRGRRETLAAVIGSLLPVVFWSYWIWANGGALTAPAMAVANAFSVGSWEYPRPEDVALTARYAVAGVWLILLLFSAAAILSSTEMRTRAVKNNVFMMWFLFVSAACLLLPGASASDFALWAIPAAFLVSELFDLRRGAFPLALYLLALGGAIAAAVIPFSGL